MALPCNSWTYRHRLVTFCSYSSTSSLTLRRCSFSLESIYLRFELWRSDRRDSTYESCILRNLFRSFACWMRCLILLTTVGNWTRFFEFSSAWTQSVQYNFCVWEWYECISSLWRGHCWSTASCGGKSGLLTLSELIDVSPECICIIFVSSASSLLRVSLCTLGR